MKKITLIIVGILCFAFNVLTQIRFEPGYFVNNSGERINCLIKNVEWKNNPINFAYRFTENDSIKTGRIESVLEFGIDNFSKYVRADVEVDISSDQLNKLSKKRSPIFEQRVVFLKVLFEGKTTLYRYEDRDLVRFFYKPNDKDIEQLIYKRYIVKKLSTNSPNSLMEEHAYENNYYKQQVVQVLDGSQFSDNDIQNLRYTQRNLMKVFEKYNDKEIESKDYKSRSSSPSGRYRLAIKSGLNVSELSIFTGGKEISYSSKVNVRLGTELEMVLPFNRNKWSVFIEPTYLQYNASNNKSIEEFGLTLANSEVNYHSIEVPLGIRYYMFLNEKSKIFVNGAVTFDHAFDSNIVFYNEREEVATLDMATGMNFAIGGGYFYKDRVSLEVRAYTHRRLLSEHLRWTTNYSVYSLVFGVRLF